MSSRVWFDSVEKNRIFIGPCLLRFDDWIVVWFGEWYGILFVSPVYYIFCLRVTIKDAYWASFSYSNNSHTVTISLFIVWQQSENVVVY